MNKWGEIKNLTLHKLFLTEEEASQQNYLEKMPAYANEALKIIGNSFKAKVKLEVITTTVANDIYKMDKDFLSFNDRPSYFNGMPNPLIIYLADNIIQLPDIGTYMIPYNSLWEEISEEDINDDTILDIDSSVLQCLPTYIASQLLSQDDIQRGTILRNEFEVMCNRLDDDRNESNSFYSQGGWY